MKLKINEKFLYVFAVLFLFTFLNHIAYADSINVETKLDSSFTLKFGDSVEIKSESLKIEFFDIFDSRCPADVTCIWEGESSIFIKLIKNVPIPKETILEIKSSEGNMITYDSKLLKITSVLPYPISAKEFKKEDYSVTLNIKKLSNPPPLKQFNNGVYIENIKCKETMMLIKKYNGFPACVFAEHYDELLSRNWTKV